LNATGLVPEHEMQFLKGLGLATTFTKVQFFNYVLLVRLGGALVFTS
jgi:hypothetical protein